MFGVHHGRGKATTLPLLLLLYPQMPEEFQTVTAHKQTLGAHANISVLVERLAKTNVPAQGGGQEELPLTEGNCSLSVLFLRPSTD